MGTAQVPCSTEPGPAERVVDVTDAATGEPIPSAFVEVRFANRPAVAQGSTDAFGRFCFELSEGAVIARVDAGHPEYWPETLRRGDEAIDLTNDFGIAGIPVKLERFARTVLVEDARTGKPIQAADVRVSFSNSFSTPNGPTDAFGEFRVRVSPQRGQRRLVSSVSVTHPDYEPKRVGGRDEAFGLPVDRGQIRVRLVRRRSDTLAEPPNADSVLSEMSANLAEIIDLVRDAFAPLTLPEELGPAFKVLKLWTDTRQARNILEGPGGQILAEGPYLELARILCELLKGDDLRSPTTALQASTESGRISLDRAGVAGDPAFRVTAPLVSDFTPAVFGGDLALDGTYSNHGITVLSSFFTDGAGSVVLGGDGSAAAGTAGGLERLAVYPDPANFVHRVYRVDLGEVSFLGNWPFPPGVTQVGPVFGGAQFQVARLDGDHAVVVASFSATVEDLPDQGPCAPFTREAELHVTVYRLDGTVVSSHRATTLDGTFGAGCDRPIWTELEVLGDGIVTTTLGLADGILLVHTDTGVRDTPGAAVEPASSRLVGPLPLPAELAANGFFNLGSYGDARSGDLLVDVPFGPRFEWSADAARLGIGPEPVPRRAPPLDPRNPVAVDELVADATTLTRVGVVDDADLAALVTGASADRLEELTIASDGASGEPTLAFVDEAGCVDTDRTLCLNDNRFAISVAWQSPQGGSGIGHARPLTNDSGTFWFFQRSNRELIAKVIDGCALGGHYWVFVAGLTNVAVQIEAWDRLTGNANVYGNPQGRTFQPILDTSAFACTDQEIARALEREAHRAPLQPRLVADRSDGGASPCGGTADALCLNGDRFRVEVESTDHAGVTRTAFGGQLTDDTGALFFFDPSNAELLIKVLDGCAFNGRYWVFAAGLTNVGVDLTVVDTATGDRKQYTSLRGTDFETVTDTDAFATCP